MFDNNNNILEIGENCFGCYSCFNICPNNAIEMKENDEGFKYPIINDNCTNCGLCRKVCPHLISFLKNNSEPDCYAYMSEDDVRIKSSSGGAFPILAKYFIEHNGYVAGAVYKEDISVHHIISKDVNDIEKMRNSKYLQSNVENCYKETKNILEKNKLVLFTGTPCQIAGLKSFLGKDYENLYCVDIICHGVPSPKVFRKYINEKISNKDEKWLNTNFRDKFKGLWSKLTTTTTTTTTTTDSAKNDLYMRAFLSNLCLRKTCTNCKFQTIPRQGDVTIGDFWGIWKFDKKLNDEKGTSVVLNNNKKGTYLIDILKNNSKVFKKVPIKYAIGRNPCLINSVKPHKDRKLFFKLLNKCTLKENVDICLDDKVNYLVVNFWDSEFNYGALLTSYAMQELIQSFGYIIKFLDTGIRTNADFFKDSFMQKFVNRFLNVTNKLSPIQINELSKSVKGIILGSDQVLRLHIIKFFIHYYLLNFIDNSTRKIALSASFGINKEEFLSYSEYTHDNAKLMKSALQSFDYLSCREISGKEIYKDVFNLDSDWIFDPVFLINKDKYEKILQCATIDNSNKIVSYVLDDNKEYDKLYEYLSEKENLEVEKIDRKNCLVENWLKSIKDCELLVTDSFHGVCFALIFNKPFICIRNKNRGNARFETLIEYFDIQNNFVYSIDEIYDKDFEYNVDYTRINNLISEKRTKDLEIIEKVLNENYSNNPNAKQNKIKNLKYLKSRNSNIERIKLLVDYFRCYTLANFTIGIKKEHYINKKYCIKQKIKQWKIF